MTIRRLTATAALLAAATLALTACDPNGTGTDSAAPAAGASAPAATTTGSTDGTASSAPSAPSASSAPSGSRKATGASSTASAKPGGHAGSTGPTGTAAPTADCTTAAQRPGHKVVNVTAATATTVTATPTRFVCGPEVENDGYYTPTGAATARTFAPGATASLFVMGDTMGPKAVSLTVFAQHAGDCAHNAEVPEPYSCYGGNYDITVDPAGRITSVTELFHP